jgi:hypothetical protein
VVQEEKRHYPVSSGWLVSHIPCQKLVTSRPATQLTPPHPSHLHPSTPPTSPHITSSVHFSPTYPTPHTLPTHLTHLTHLTPPTHPPTHPPTPSTPTVSMGGGVFLSDLTLSPVSDDAQVAALVGQGLRHRHGEEGGHRSSCSHAVFILQVG